MIWIGLTSWQEHPLLTATGQPPSLAEYAAVLPLVELDTPYYGIPKTGTAEKWLKAVPRNFRFLLKANQKMTGQKELEAADSDEAVLFETYRNALAPLQTAGQLAGILFQYPAAFHCTPENVAKLRQVAAWMAGWPVVLEFRHSSWYSAAWREKMYAFLAQHKFSLAMIDEPQVANQSVPFDCHVTNGERAVFRFHGRNQQGWQSKEADWRKKRTLYCYNEEELQALATAVKEVAAQVPETYVIFNNNSGGDAAANALQLKKILGIQYHHLNPKQMSLFD